MSYEDSFKNWRQVVSQMEPIVFPAIRERRDVSNARMVSLFASSHRSVSFPVGSHVMAKDMVRDGKLSPFYEGPYKVARRNKGGAYLLIDHDGVLLPRNFAPSQLVAVPSPSQEIPVAEVHTVERIINHRNKGRNIQYLTKWKGFDDNHNT